MRFRSKHDLNRWLRREVLGEETPRKPPAKARRASPARDEPYKAWIRQHPCVACGSSYSIEAAHTGSDGGASQKASDYSCIPLCRDCHTQAAGAYHRVGRAAFERRRGLDCARIAAGLRRAWEEKKDAVA